MRLRLLSVAAALLTLGVVAAGTGVASAQSGQPSTSTLLPCNAVVHHETANHAGLSCTSLSSAPKQKWSVQLNGSPGYPIIAGGRVFVSTTSRTVNGGWLYAVDAATGRIDWGPVTLPSTDTWFPMAYDNGSLFINDESGTVFAYAAATGRQVWATPTEYLGGEPTVARGVVYVHGASSVWAIAETSGAIVWRSPMLGGNGGSVSVNDNGVFVASGCSQYELSLANGAVIWSNNPQGMCGGGGTTYLSGGRVYSSVDQVVLNQQTGKAVGTYDGVPAFSGTSGYFSTLSGLIAESTATGAPLFKTTVSGHPYGSPVIAGSTVYIATVVDNIGPMLYGISAQTGAVTWKHNLPSIPLRGLSSLSNWGDLAVGDGVLVVPTDNLYAITAFG